MKSLRAVPVVAVLAVAAALVSGCGEDTSNSATPLDPTAAAGKALAVASCMGCHSTDGSSKSGPTWKGLAGSQVTLADGRTVTADDAYLQRSIQDPGADVVKGYPDTMKLAISKGSISDADAKALVAYMKTLH
jgi:cytochrome c oxidase subunit II